MKGFLRIHNLRIFGEYVYNISLTLYRGVNPIDWA